MSDETCANPACANVVSDEDYCFGCKQKVCEECSINLTLMGSHSVEEHWDEDADAWEYVEDD